MGVLLDIQDWLVFGGRLHPLIVHLPIGVLLLAALLEMLSRTKRFSHLQSLLSFVWLTGAVTAVVACVAGFLLAEESGYDEDVLFYHQWLGIAVAVFSTLFVITSTRRVLKPSLRVAISVVIILLLSMAGHFGGTLTHGEEFLNEPLMTALGKVSQPPAKIKRKPITNIAEATVYTDLITPILEEKCYKCHSASKKKGKLRLDTYELMLKGGEHGNSMVMGDAARSELYKRLILPVEDKKRMPPKGKAQLKASEIELIHWWIQQGQGSSVKRVGEIAQTDPIKNLLVNFVQQEEVTQEFESELPEVSVGEVSEELLKPLRYIGLSVNKFSPDQPFLTINCVNVEHFSDDQIKLLLPIKDQVIWLKAGNTKLTDKAMKTIGQMKNLSRLSLEYTTISDLGLSALNQLSNLRYLNLVGTQVSSASMKQLSLMKKLHSVYLWKTRYDKQSALELSKLLNGAEVNVGNVE